MFCKGRTPNQQRLAAQLVENGQLTSAIDRTCGEISRVEGQLLRELWTDANPLQEL